MRIAQASGELHYDESPVLGTTLADLSLTAFAAYHSVQYGITLEEQLAQSDLGLPQLLRNLRLLHDLDGEQMLSVAALLVFGEAPQRFMPQSRLSAVAFAGANEDSDISGSPRDHGALTRDHRRHPGISGAQYPDAGY